MAWPAQAALAALLGETADRPATFPGIGPLPDRPIRLVLAPSRAAFDSITRGRLPAWSDGAAFPEIGTLVVLAAGSPDRVAGIVRHELGHLALRWHLRQPVPLWFEEGYAAVAAGEWGRLDALRLNWRVARGVFPGLADVDRGLRGERGDAETAYAFAASAVLLLQRLGGERGLGPFLERLGDGTGFEAAMRATYLVTGDAFEDQWKRDLGSRYGWLSWAAGVGLFWTFLAVLLVVLWRIRRRRDQARRARLDEGWVIPTEEPNP